VVPYKRFATPWLFSRAKQYLSVPEEQPQGEPAPQTPKQNATRVTYRSAVRHDRQKIGYPPQPSAPQGAQATGHQPVSPPTLLWRFIGWLGSHTLSLDKARELILKYDPNSTCHRVQGSVDPFKARSDKRLESLETARQLLLIMPEWERCFGRPLFPQFATRAGFS
jgi:hypothetical protein